MKISLKKYLSKLYLKIKGISKTKVIKHIYLVKVCCTVKPSQYKLELPSRTGRSIYKQDYLPKSSSTDLFIKYEPYSPKYPPNFQTSYNVKILFDLVWLYTSCFKSSI